MALHITLIVRSVSINTNYSVKFKGVIQKRLFMAKVIKLKYIQIRITGIVQIKERPRKRLQ